MPHGADACGIEALHTATSQPQPLQEAGERQKKVGLNLDMRFWFLGGGEKHGKTQVFCSPKAKAGRSVELQLSGTLPDWPSLAGGTVEIEWWGRWMSDVRCFSFCVSSFMEFVCALLAKEVHLGPLL